MAERRSITVANTSTAVRGVTAVVLGGGIGERMGLSVPKQLLKVAGRTILEHTVAALASSPQVDEIIVMMTASHLAVAEELAVPVGQGKVVAVVAGGTTRNETTERAIAEVGRRLAADEDDRILLFHDAVRPLLSPRVVTDCVAALQRHQAVDVAIPSADTVVVTRTHGDEGEFITEIPDRSRLRRGQTPQGFWLSTIRRAYEIASLDPNFQATDDCSVVLKYLPDVPILVVRGDDHNMKVTHPLDVYLIDKLFQLASQEPPPSHDDGYYRAALEGRTVVVFGGSYGIGAGVAELAGGYGANVLALGRSTTGTDVRSPQDIEDALAEAKKRFGGIDFVVNSAGSLQIGQLADQDDEQIDEALAVNYLAPIRIARAARPYLAETCGHLLFYTSSSYTRGRAGYSLYSSAKAAVVNLAQALADEWAEDGIRVNCINPERTRTPMRQRAFGDEHPGTLLSAAAVARTSLDMLLAPLTGQVVDIRLHPAGVPRGLTGAAADAAQAVMA
ncbi:SDR family NAD(P)-dependent oxidoreductase [Streptacidiphilus sp. N1-12]|uniref:2-C-methyl-D-erythritol 4-phosphate cytidylyltransferase n=2 Tax=Streptacidiphilus alkalitolerans TaxID=3342712 RepID=A0ABV6WD43_9ACTN